MTRVEKLETRPMDALEWRGWERLIDHRRIVIDRPRGVAHLRYPDMIYPFDYGHVPGTAAAAERGPDLQQRAGEASALAKRTLMSACLPGD